MTKVIIKDDDIIPYGIIKHPELSKIEKSVNNSLIALTLILKNTDKLIPTLDSVKSICNTFIVFNNTTNKSVVEEYCNTHNITLHLKERLGEIDDDYKTQLLKFADEVLVDKNNKKEEKYILMLDEGEELENPQELIKFVEENKKTVHCYALRCQYPVKAGIMYVKLIKSHKGLKIKNGLINLVQMKGQPSKEVITLENIIINIPWNKKLMALVMMVKNEHLRLEHSFDSVKDFTDTFII